VNGGISCSHLDYLHKIQKYCFWANVQIIKIAIQIPSFFFFFHLQIQTSLPQLKSYILQTNFSIFLPIILAPINSKPYNKLLYRNSNIKFGITAFCLHHSLFISLSRIHTCTHAQRRHHTRAHAHTYKHR
jgi:hypothetical protein